MFPDGYAVAVRVMCVPWRIYTGDMTRWVKSARDFSHERSSVISERRSANLARWVCRSCVLYVCCIHIYYVVGRGYVHDVTYLYVWHDSWLIHLAQRVCRCCVCHECCIYIYNVVGRAYIYNVTYSNVCHGSGILPDGYTAPACGMRAAWRMYICDTTHWVVKTACKYLLCSEQYHHSKVIWGGFD